MLKKLGLGDYAKSKLDRVFPLMTEPPADNSTIDKHPISHEQLYINFWTSRQQKKPHICDPKLYI